MGSEHGKEKYIVSYVVVVALAVAALVIGRPYLLRAWARRAGDRAAHAHLQERRREFSVVREKLKEFRELDERERAKAVWQLWCYVIDKEWEGHPKGAGERWVAVPAIRRELLQPEIESLGDSGFDALVEEIRNPSGESRFFRSLHAAEASRYLCIFGEGAVYALIEILETENPETQLVALKGLWSCIAVLELTEEPQRAMVDAVTPFLDSPDESLREWAEIVLGDLPD